MDSANPKPHGMRASLTPWNTVALMVAAEAPAPPKEITTPRAVRAKPSRAAVELTVAKLSRPRLSSR